MSQKPPSVGAHPCTEYSDFILDIEGLLKIKCKQDFEKPNDEARQEYHGGIPEVQHVNAHTYDGSGVR